MTVMVGLVPGCTVPVLADNSSCRDIIVRLSAPAESVGEYLVHNSALKKIGSEIVIGIYSQLEKFTVLYRTLMRIDTLDVIAYSSAGIGEVVVVDIGVSCVIIAGIYEAVLLLGGNVHRYEALLEACSEENKYRRIVGTDILREPY